MATQEKIQDRDQLLVCGVRYEWNPVFHGYWSVNGQPRELQQADLSGLAEVAAGEYAPTSTPQIGH